ncbi:MAG: HIT family protein [Gammaproteobacteria bacterium]|nr:HIT family protein [Gammaproteobacteria bacterium]
MPEEDNCIFCRIVTGDIPCHKLYEDDTTLAFMDINPANPGHALVIPKSHWPDVATIPAEAIGRVAATAKTIAEAVIAALAPDGLNLVQANGRGAAQSVPHLHIHVVPRQRDDGLKLNWGLTPGEPGEIAEWAERIRGELNKK